MHILGRNGVTLQVGSSDFARGFKMTQTGLKNVDNIGAILAVADWLSRTAHTTNLPSLTMETVLLGIIKTYEIQGCFQTRNAFNKMGLDHTILVRVASTAVICHLIGCSESQTLAGISHAFVDAGPLRIYRQSPNAGPRKGWAAGDACMRAVQIAFMAKSGQPGVPTVLSDPKWGFYYVMNNGKEFQLPKPLGNSVVESTFFKIHCAEGHAASAVEAALIVSKELRAHNPCDVWPIEEKISHVRVRTQKPAMIIINKQGALHNAADRDHCMQYMVAVVLLKGSMITAADYGDDSQWATDPRVDILRAKIEMTEDPQLTLDYHNEKKRSGANALVLTLADGTKMEEVLVEYPTGHPWRDDTSGFVKEKFKCNVRGWFAEQNANSIVDLAETELKKFMMMGVSEFVETFSAGGGDILSAATSESDNQASIMGTTSTDMVQTQSRTGKLREQNTEWDGESYFSAFAPGKSPHPSPHVSHGLPFHIACAKHVAEMPHASRVYILVSASLSNKTSDLPILHSALDDKLGEDSVVGIQRGVKPHTYYSDILKIVKEAKDANATCLVTLGGGSLTDTAKVVALVSTNLCPAALE